MQRLIADETSAICAVWFAKAITSSLPDDIRSHCRPCLPVSGGFGKVRIPGMRRCRIPVEFGQFIRDGAFADKQTRDETVTRAIATIKKLATQDAWQWVSLSLARPIDVHIANIPGCGVMWKIWMVKAKDMKRRHAR